MPQRQDGSETRKQTPEGDIVCPSRQFDRFEAVGKPVVGQQCPSGFRRTGADQWHFEFIGQESDHVQEDPLLAFATDEQRMDFVDDKHPRPNDPKGVASHSARTDAADLSTNGSPSAPSSSS